METVNVYVVTGAVKAPERGDLFVTKKGTIVKRKQPAKSGMLRRIAEVRQASKKLKIDAKSVFLVTGEKRMPEDGEHFLTDRGLVATEGVKGWGADDERQILIPVRYHEGTTLPAGATV